MGGAGDEGREGRGHRMVDQALVLGLKLLGPVVVESCDVRCCDCYECCVTGTRGAASRANRAVPVNPARWLAAGARQWCGGGSRLEAASK
jgi:hypothetical protein